MAMQGYESLEAGPSGVTIRPFVPGVKDDKACKDLEAKASMVPKAAQWLVNGQFKHHFNFDRKVSQFPQQIVLLAETDDAKAIGMVVSGLKQVYLPWVEEAGKQPIWAMYIFDLRVDQAFQTKGLGRQLMDAVLKRGVELGANYAYLSVNSDNEKAMKLFMKLGFSECSDRWPCGGLLSKKSAVAPPPSTATIERLDGSDAKAALVAQLGKVDLAPMDVGALTDSPFFLGTFIAREDASNSQEKAPSVAAVSLWDGSALQSWEFTRLLFPASWYRRWPFLKYVLLLGYAGPLCLFARHIFGLFSRGTPIWGGFESLLFGGILFMSVKAAPIFTFFFSSVNMPSSKTNARLWAPSAEGSQGEKLLAAAVSQALEHAKDHGFQRWICNVDERYPHRAALPGPGMFRTKFMQKPLDDAAAELRRLRPTCFHDPRDS